MAFHSLSLLPKMTVMSMSYLSANSFLLEFILSPLGACKKGFLEVKRCCPKSWISNNPDPCQFTSLMQLKWFSFIFSTVIKYISTVVGLNSRHSLCWNYTNLDLSWNFTSARGDMIKYPKNAIVDVTFYRVLLLWKCCKNVLLSFLHRFHVHDAYLCAIKVWWLQCTVLTATVREGLKHFRISASVLYWFQEQNGRRGCQVPENSKHFGPNSPLG